MPHFIITKTTVETLGIDVATLADANKAALKGQGDTVSINTNIVVRPRPPAPLPNIAGGPAIPGTRLG